MLDAHFNVKTQPKANLNNIIIDDHVRFTLIESRLIRIEYSPCNEFEDHASQKVWFRHFEDVPYDLKKTNECLIIQTKDLRVTYQLNQPFNQDSLQIKVLKNNKTWCYSSEEPNNLKGTYRTLDNYDGDIDTQTHQKMPLGKGVCSRDGYAFIDDSDSLIINGQMVEARLHDQIDGYFFGFNHDYNDAVAWLYKITGKTPIVPRFVLGNWWSRFWRYDEQSLKGLISQFNHYQIPLSVCIIDMDWHIVDVPHFYFEKGFEITSAWTGYSWNKTLFPDPKRMLEWLHAKGLKTSLNVHPADGVGPFEDMYEEMAVKMGIDPKTYLPVAFDIASPEFIKNYFEVIHYPYEKMGVDFWWLDWQQGNKTKVKGLDPLWMLNHLHFLDSKKNNTRGLTFSRYSDIGSHRYPIGFSGDSYTSWESLKFQPYFTSTASNVGYGWWSHDIGGHFMGHENPELYARWVQLGCFSPILRLHSSSSPFSRREPFNYDLNVLHATTKFMRLRHALIPYLYSNAYLNYANNQPLVRPLYYLEHCDASYRYHHCYGFGDQMVVASIVTPKTSYLNHSRVDFYLPKGNWFNLFSHEYYQGQKEYTGYYKLDEYPVFIKAGGILPLNPNTTSNGVSITKLLKYEIFLNADNEFVLYEDNDQTNDYEQGFYSQQLVQLKDQKQLVTITFNAFKGEFSGQLLERDYEIIINNVALETEVYLDLDGLIPLTYTRKDDSIIVNLEEISKDQTVRLVLKHQRSVYQKLSKDLNTTIIEIIRSLDVETAIKNLMFPLINDDSLVLKLQYLSRIKPEIDQKYPDLSAMLQNILLHELEG